MMMCMAAAQVGGYTLTATPDALGALAGLAGSLSELKLDGLQLNDQKADSVACAVRDGQRARGGTRCGSAAVQHAWRGQGGVHFLCTVSLPLSLPLFIGWHACPMP